jgi:TolB-like protein
LDNLSGDPAQEYLADGMTDELITMLAKNSTLRIVSRTSVMQYKSAHRPLPEIARALGVDGILEGTISRSAERVHMNIQLIQAPSDTHVWAESYDRALSNTASLPEDAAEAIAKRLKSVVPKSNSSHFVSSEAHDAYLHGRYLWFVGKNEEAGQYFKQATELQPDYALGWAGVAMYYDAGVATGELDPRQALPLGHQAALKSIALDDLLPEAHLVMGGSEYFDHWNWDEALREISRAIELDPKYAEAYHLRTKVLATLNRHAEAIEAQKISSELDPFARPWALAVSYALARQFDKTISEASARLVSNPDDTDLHFFLSYAYGKKGMPEKDEQELEEALKLAGDQSGAVSAHHAYQQGGPRAVDALFLRKLKQKSLTRYVSPVALAAQYALVGQKDQAVALLEEGFQQHAASLLVLQDNGSFDNLHSDERYRSIIRRMGLPPAY